MSTDAGGQERALELFAAAVELPEEQRAAWLDDRCRGDTDLRDRLERLLAADRDAGRLFPPRPSLEALLDEPALGLAPGTLLGPYRLRERIATGGMGTVWLAEQSSPRRLVALKALRSDLPGRETLRRFRAEAELVARLRHPGVAQVFDAGTCTVDGREIPYIVMEHVEGSRGVVEAAEALQLDRRARLRLFAEICDAVHHGHQRGVIHRDLKPGNVLVDAEGRPKVIDFGLARALDPGRLAVSVAETRAGEIFGTLAYMSPEQVGGNALEVDVRTDVYALGCLLCELLTGRVPLEVDGLPLPEVGRRIVEDAPSLPAELPRDVRWILTKALEKDPSRRYASASELAADVRRALDAQPVLAGPPSSFYQVSRFARRHRVVLLAALAVAAALLVGLLRARAGARAADRARLEALAASGRAEQARELAERQAELARTASFFLSDLFHSSGVYELGTSARVVDALAAAEERLPAIEDPVARAILTSIVGRAYLDLDERARALPLIHASANALRGGLALDDPFRLNAEVVLADLLEQEQRFAESRALSEELLPRLEERRGPAHPETLYLRFNLAVCCFRLGEPRAAEEHFRRSLELVERDWEGQDTTARRRDLWKWIGSTLVEQGRHEDALGALAKALELARASGGSPVNEATILMEIGTVRLRLQGPELALANLEEAERLHALGQPSDGNRFALAFNLATCLRRLGRLDEAERQAAKAAAALAAGWPTPDARHVLLGTERTRIALGAGDLERAAATGRATLAVAEERLAPGAAELEPLRAALAEALVRLGRPDEVEAVLRGRGY